MNDIELLKFAAKACGYEVRNKRLRDNSKVPELFVAVGNDVSTYRWWCPLADGGHALQLAADLSMTIEIWPGDVRVTTTHRVTGDEDVEETAKGNIHEAVRRAIVICAAEIGRKMP